MVCGFDCLHQHSSMTADYIRFCLLAITPPRTSSYLFYGVSDELSDESTKAETAWLFGGPGLWTLLPLPVRRLHNSQKRASIIAEGQRQLSYFVRRTIVSAISSTTPSQFSDDGRCDAEEYSEGCPKLHGVYVVLPGIPVSDLICLTSRPCVGD